jgi:LytS/YehU family sensor histidine kinase
VLCIIIGTIGTIFILYHFTHRYKLARQRRAEYDKKLAEMKLLTVKNQLEPHFTFNALNSMAAVVLNKENMRAYDYLSKFSKMIRLSLDQSETILRSLEEELNFVRHYLDIQKLRFDNKFSYEINIDEEVDTAFTVPKMIVHNYVENAVKHGIKHKKGKGFITITVQKDNRNMLLIVEDNGIGRKKAREIGSDSSGKGLKTLKEYCRIFNKYNTEKIRMHIEDLYDASKNAAGTRVEIKIPLNYKYEVAYAES